MTAFTVPATVSSRLRAHADRARRHRFVRSSNASLAVVLDVLDDLGWKEDRFLDIGSEMPRSSECIGLGSGKGTPYALIVGEAAGCAGADPQMHDAARSAGYPFLIGTDARSWTFVDLSNDRALTLPDMIVSPEAPHCIAALSSGADALESMKGLLRCAHYLEEGERALAEILLTARDMLLPGMARRLAARGEVVDEDRLRSLLLSVRLPIETLLPDPGEVVTSREIISAPAKEESGSVSRGRIVGRRFTSGKKSRTGRKFSVLMTSKYRCSLLAGSQISAVPVSSACRDQGCQVRISQSHADIVDRGDVVKGLDASGKDCLILTRDVTDLSPSRALYAIYGNSRSMAKSLYCAQTGLSLAAIAAGAEGDRQDGVA